LEAIMRLGLRRSVITVLLPLTFLLLGLAPSGAQQRQQGEPGKFDFYVLSLSWSPSFCEAGEERAANRRSDPQCDGARPFSFVVHGLWPQYERGFPSWCQVPAPRIPRSLADGMLDIMPSQRLVFHEWDRHGTCSGLSAQAFFDTMRKARAEVRIPETFVSLDKPRMVSPGEVLDAFLQANPKLARDEIAIACDDKRLTEVRICMSKELGFRKCPQVAERSCTREKIVMPAVRAGLKRATTE
jgi:ribonuclease T2